MSSSAKHRQRRPRTRESQYIHHRRCLKKAQSLVPSILVLLKNSSIGGRAGRGTHPLGPPACLLGNSARHLALGAILAHPGVSGHPQPHHGLTVQIQEQTTTVRPTTVSYSLHPGQTQSVSYPRGLQLLYPTLMDRGEGQQRLSWPGGVVLHSHGAGQDRGGNGHSERQPQDPASYHKVPPISEAVPTGSLPLLYMCTYKHTHAHIHTHMKMPTHTHTCSHTCNT